MIGLAQQVGKAPVRQDAAAEEGGIGVAIGRPADVDEEVRIDPMVIVHEGHHIAIQPGNGAVQGVRLTWRGFRKPFHGDGAGLRLSLLVVLQQLMGAFTAGARGREQIDGPVIIGSCIADLQLCWMTHFNQLYCANESRKLRLYAVFYASPRKEKWLMRHFLA